MESRFLNSEVPEPEKPEFTALGQAGSDHYAGLETFDNPGCVFVVYTSDEVVAHCPVTGQPDFYTCSIQLRDPEKCIESKSLKLWFRQFALESGPGIFCEGLAVFIRDQVMEAIGEEDEDKVQVTLDQKPRGGISIRSVA
jgi:7-cyano-7-deazaguanine reductase